ncbi:hypothetical protein [Pararobbsia silviterrae]|uniref:hypothetical protein n=1 Tax=Pararobbsia silviterrae TaxID=1792498 RepID=UPI0013149FE2|nr:hypothetical protein [Pararobbsia silviterrae]
MNIREIEKYTKRHKSDVALALFTDRPCRMRHAPCGEKPNAVPMAASGVREPRTLKRAFKRITQ